MPTGADKDDDTRALKRRCRVCSQIFDRALIACPICNAPLEDVLEPGNHLVAAYSYDSTLGKGGMGVIYKAHHEVIDRVVAIKMLTASHLTEEDIHRFQREGKAIGRLHHPNIIHVFEFGVTSEGYPYMVMDFVNGMSLAQLIKKSAGLPMVQAFEIILQICAAMDHAHALGVVHRDLKPSNVMLETGDDGTYTVKIVDFGIAKILYPGREGEATITRTGEIFGSPTYMSPEQAQGKPSDHRSDIYSMGCVLYEMLSGVTPLEADTAVEMVLKHINETPSPLREALPERHFPECLEYIVAKMLEKEPARRFQSCQALMVALEDCRAGRFAFSENSTRHVSKVPLALQVVAVFAVVFSVCTFLALAFVENHDRLAKRSNPITPAIKEPAAKEIISAKESEAYGKQLIEEADANDGRLDLSGPGLAITPQLIADIKEHRHIIGINLKGKSVSREAFQALTTLPLQSLNLTGTALDPQALTALQTMPMLTELSLGPNHELGSRFSPAVLTAVGKLKGLTRLHLRACHLVDGDLAYLTNLDELRELDLASNPVTAACLPFLNRFPKLVVLNLQDATQLPISSLAKLERLRFLKNLDIQGTTASDEDIGGLVKQAPQLEELSIGSPLLTDRCLASLSKLHGLNQLNVLASRGESLKITGAGLANFRRQFPECNVATNFAP